MLWLQKTLSQSGLLKCFNFMEDSMAKGWIIALSCIFMVTVTASVPAAQDTSSSEGSTTSSSSYRSQWRGGQQQILSRLDDLVAKLKASMASSGRRMRSWRGVSEAERNKMREQYRKMRDERMKTIESIEDQMLYLKGRSAIYLEYDDTVGRLYDIVELAKKENAEGTVEALEALIAAENAAFDKKMEELGMQ